MESPDDIDAIAAALRADSNEANLLLDVVALKLEDALPGLTKVTRAGRISPNHGHVQRLHIAIDDKRFTLERESHGTAAAISHVVHGITLSTDTVTVDRWLNELALSLSKLAASQTRARDALDQLLRGPRD